MQLKEKELKCPVCQELPEEAVESSCCHGLFCNLCSSKLKCSLSESRCSYCGEVATFSACHFLRKRIGQLRVQCRIPGCKVEMAECRRKDHESNCDFRKDPCVWCGGLFTRREISEHLKSRHPKETAQVLLRAEPLQGFIQLAEMREFQPLQKIKNGYGRLASLGHFTKYYCGGPLETKCDCCEGTCGPFDGNNCRACMLLDVSLRRLDYGKYLVNKEGRICVVSGARVWCGTKTYESACKDHYCRECQGCEVCQCLMRDIARYLDVQSELSELVDPLVELLL
jgi:hypothetical protein